MANKGKQRYYDINNLKHYIYGIKISKRGENAFKRLMEITNNGEKRKD